MKTKYKKPDWAHTQITRYDRNGMVEDICRLHGCGHPNKEWLNSPENKDKNGEIRDSGIHGCCGCCREGVPYTPTKPIEIYKAGDKNWYKKGIRILMLIHRQKDGGTNRKDRGSVRRVSRNEKEFDKYYEELVKQKGLSQLPLRIYCSVNARDYKRAIRMYKIQQVEIEGQGEEAQTRFYIQSENQFFSCLAKPPCAKTKWFMIDLDTHDPDEVEKTLNKLTPHTQILDMRTTPNGFHIITEPFNPALAEGLDIKKDAMLLLDW